MWLINKLCSKCSQNSEQYIIDRNFVLLHEFLDRKSVICKKKSAICKSSKLMCINCINYGYLFLLLNFQFTLMNLLAYFLNVNLLAACDFLHIIEKLVLSVKV